jgi:hypothetical protein
MEIWGLDYWVLSTLLFVIYLFVYNFATRVTHVLVLANGIRFRIQISNERQETSFHLSLFLWLFNQFGPSMTGEVPLKMQNLKKNYLLYQHVQILTNIMST